MYTKLSISQRLKVLCAIMCLIMVLFCCTACGSASPKKSIVGEWNYDSANEITIVFYDDGTFDWIDENVTGSYSIKENNSLYMNVSETSEILSFVWTDDADSKNSDCWNVNGNTLLLDGETYCRKGTEPNEIENSINNIENSNMTVSSIFDNASLQYPGQNDSLKYNVYTDFVEITGFVGNMSEISIPDSIENLPVKAIGDSAFFNCEALKTINISDTVVEIGSNTFRDCENLESVHLGNSIIRIGSHAFQGCKALKAIVIPNSCVEVEGGAFSYCYSLQSVILSNNIHIIPYEMFASCKSLRAIELNNSITCIGDGAFNGCETLNSIVLPSSVTEIGGSAFKYCSSLKSIDLPDGITKINYGTFEFCSSLKEVTIPASVEECAVTTGVHVFTDCFALEKIIVKSTTLDDLALDVYNYSSSISEAFPNLVVYGYSGSKIAQYCANQGIRFSVIQ